MSIVKMLLLAGAMAFALEALLSHMHSKPEEEQPEDASEAVEDNGAEEAEGEADFSDDEEDDGEAEDVEQLPTTSCRACVKSAFRAMNPLTLLGESRVVFVLNEDGKEAEFRVQGESGLHLAAGDTGMLEYCGVSFISFEKDNGEFCGQLFYAPAQEAEADA